MYMIKAANNFITYASIHEDSILEAAKLRTSPTPLLYHFSYLHKGDQRLQQNLRSESRFFAASDLPVVTLDI